MFGEYIDSHNHMHALNRDEWELLGATIMSDGRDANKSFLAVFSKMRWFDFSWFPWRKSV